jgi:hypothetical protein
MGVVTPVREFRADRQKPSNSRAVSGRPPERRRDRCPGRSGRRPRPDAPLGPSSVRSPMFSGSRRGAVPQSLVANSCSCPRTREPHRSLGTSNRLSPLHRGRPRLSVGEYRVESYGGAGDRGTNESRADTEGARRAYGTAKCGPPYPRRQYAPSPNSSVQKRFSVDNSYIGD